LVSKIVDRADTCDLYISEELYESFKQSGLIPKAEDILVTSRGTLGLCYIVNEWDRFYFQDGMISWLDKKADTIDSAYLMHLFVSDEIKRQIEQVSAGSTVNYLSLANLENFKILYPPLPLQHRFADFVRQAYKSKFELQHSLDVLELLNKSLIQKCFNGEIF
jgi:type I restriction enzyme S subunit